MFSIKLALSFALVVGCVLLPINCGADEQHSWKDTNNQAIQAMRNGNYDESERLFKQALTECADADSRGVVQDNLNVLLQKEGKTPEGTGQKNADAPQKSDATAGGATAGKDDIHSVLNQLDAQIRTADEHGDLETLQGLFKKKAEALKIRDGSETLDYAYCLHFRAQVLENMHKDDEAKALEAEAAKLRDALRQLSASGGPAAPQRTRSQLGKMKFNTITEKGERIVGGPAKTYYGDATPENRNASHTFRSFAPANSGNTSGYLNGNPNPPPGTW